MPYYNKLKAMQIISRYEIFKEEWNIEFHQNWIEIQLVDEEGQEVSSVIFWFHEEVFTMSLDVSSVDFQFMHEIYYLAEELKDCKEVEHGGC